MKIPLLAMVGAVAVLGAEPRQLFNGKNLDDWKMTGHGKFVLDNGLLKTEGGMGLLWYTGRMVGNETVRVVFKTTGPRDNSGVYIRMPEAPPDPWYGVHNGYEVQIDAAGDEWHMTGALYSLSRATKKAQKRAGEWNTMDIRMDGPLTQVTLNGEVVNDFNGSGQVPERKQWFEPVRGPRAPYGFIGLQNHDAGSTVYFKEISVIPTDKSPLPMERGERDRILSYYHSTRKQILDAAAGLSPEQFSYKPSPEKWSVAQVLEHLAMTEEFLFMVAAKYLQEPAPAPTDVKLTREQLIRNMTDRSHPVQAPAEVRPTGRWQSGLEAVNAFKSRRDHMIDWLNETKEPVTHIWASWAGQSIPVYDALYTIPAHTERHLQQINEVKASPGFPKR